MVVMELGFSPELFASFEDYVSNDASVLLASAMPSGVGEMQQGIGMKFLGGLHVTNGPIVLLERFSVVVPVDGHREGVPDKHTEEHSSHFFCLVKVHERLT
jgi:hypothetical protein